MRRHGPGGFRRRGGRWPERVYAALLWLYPPSLRREYGPDMRQAFRDTLRDETRRRGRRGALRTWALALGDLVVSLPREWPRELRRGWRPGRRRSSGITRRVRLPGGGWRVEGWIGSEPRGAGIRPAPAFGPGISAEFARRATMQDKFEKFTERARRVMSLAQEEAQRFNHNYIGTEHILLGLVAEGEGVAAKALINLGVDLNKARSAVEFIIGSGDHFVLGEIGLTPRAKKVIELAVDEAQRLGHHYIGTEHLLLGLVREGEGIAAGVLESLGVNLERARSSVMEMLVARGGAPSSALERARAPEARMVATLTLVCRDVDATATFYEVYLGAVAIPQASAEARTFTGGERLLRMPQGWPLLALRAADPAVSAATPDGAGMIELSFFVHKMDALWALWNELRQLDNELRQRNAPNLSEMNPIPNEPNARAFTLTDPDGRVVRFHGMLRA